MDTFLLPPPLWLCTHLTESLPARLSSPSLALLWLRAASAHDLLLAAGGILNVSNITIYLTFSYWQSYAHIW